MAEKKYGAVFPGQGSQYVGMGKDLYQNFRIVKEIYDIGSCVCGFDIASVCFEGPIERLTDTEICQVCLFALSLACWSVFYDEFSLMPIFAAGHSLGEYTALTCAGAFSIEDAFLLVAKRAKYMKEATLKNPGAMVAVIGKTLEEVKTLIGKFENLYISNINTPEQVVIGGGKEAVNLFIKTCEEKKVRCIPLNVSGAFHTPLMRYAADLLSEEIDKINVSACNFPVYANYNGKEISQPEEIKAALKKQMLSTVQWVEAMKSAVKKVNLIIEFGPKKVLSGLIKKIEPSISISNVEDLQSLNRTFEVMKLIT
ncbi:MAG: ACP S-malonyltransferase [Candidatus Omnitrophica bacterium]|nr:ACP S-malonyltransferase [Candidatus Omnitrophota bacterium]MCM8815970.1 ACP S-malonyltransferase [Candidatus Omnitrophota bacterium]